MPPTSVTACQLAGHQWVSSNNSKLAWSEIWYHNYSKYIPILLTLCVAQLSQISVDLNMQNLFEFLSTQI